MKKRLEKKMEKRKREQIHRLLDLALDINGLEPRKQDITGSLPTAFFFIFLDIRVGQRYRYIPRVGVPEIIQM